MLNRSHNCDANSVVTESVSETAHACNLSARLRVNEKYLTAIYRKEMRNRMSNVAAITCVVMARLCWHKTLHELCVLA